MRSLESLKAEEDRLRARCTELAAQGKWVERQTVSDKLRRNLDQQHELNMKTENQPGPAVELANRITEGTDWDSAHAHFLELMAQHNEANAKLHQLGHVIRYERALVRIGVKKADVRNGLYADRVERSKIPPELRAQLQFAGIRTYKGDPMIGVVTQDGAEHFFTEPVYKIGREPEPKPPRTVDEWNKRSDE